MQPSPAVILLSGGLDSATALALARRDGFVCHALTVNYGQRHAVELEAAARVARHLNVKEHRVVHLDLGGFGGSTLTSTETNPTIPVDRTLEQMSSGIPNTYVPARNTVLLALGLAWAETLGSFDLYFGANVLDHTGYPDCRPAFFRAFETLANLATRVGVEGKGRFRIHTPLVELGKGKIIQLGIQLGVDYALTHSCYAPQGEEGLACGRCDACVLRRLGFAEAEIPDPTRYQKP